VGVRPLGGSMHVTGISTIPSNRQMDDEPTARDFATRSPGQMRISPRFDLRCRIVGIGPTSRQASRVIPIATDLPTGRTLPREGDCSVKSAPAVRAERPRTSQSLVVADCVGRSKTLVDIHAWWHAAYHQMQERAPGAQRLGTGGSWRP